MGRRKDGPKTAPPLFPHPLGGRVPRTLAGPSPGNSAKVSKLGELLHHWALKG